jgi:hypothetical protein
MGISFLKRLRAPIARGEITSQPFAIGPAMDLN